MLTTNINLKDKPSRKRHKKFRLLLDAAFARPSVFIRLSKKANLVHVVLDLGLPPQTEDEEIYKKAVAKDRFVLTINFNDFKKLVQPGKPGIIGIESQLTNEEIDIKVTKFLSGKNPDDYLGKAIRI